MKILIVDDDPLFQRNYQLLLSTEGHEITSCSGRAEAETALQRDLFDVVLLDQNLDGDVAGPTGLDLIPRLRAASPGVAVLVVSGFWARPGAIESAFDRGATDYLVKGEHLTPLLLAKLRQIQRDVETRQQVFASRSRLESRLSAVWTQLDVETGTHAKGKLLEELVTLLLRLAGGFRDVRANVANAIEELDVVAFADEDSRWFKHSPLYLVECKNWSTTVGRDELDVLAAKMGRRHGQCRRGLMVTLHGVSPAFRQVARTYPTLVIAIADAADLERAVRAPDRAAEIQRWFDAATLDT